MKTGRHGRASSGIGGGGCDAGDGGAVLVGAGEDDNNGDDDDWTSWNGCEVWVLGV